MAFVKNALQELADGKMYLKITPGRAQAMLTALAIALASGELDKRMKGVVRGMREFCSLRHREKCCIAIRPALCTLRRTLVPVANI